MIKPLVELGALLARGLVGTAHASSGTAVIILGAVVLSASAAGLCVAAASEPSDKTQRQPGGVGLFLVTVVTVTSLELAQPALHWAHRARIWKVRPLL